MRIKFKHTAFFSIVFYLLACHNLPAIEFDLSGLAQIEYSYISNNQNSELSEVGSFLDGDYGKFAADSGSNLSISQAALSLTMEISELISANIVTNAYLGTSKDNIGITEGYLKFKSIPSKNGVRIQSRAGIIYPSISMENIATAWSTPYTLNSSTLNSWIAEEVRHRGLEASIEKLGKFSGSNFDLRLTATIFDNNDTNGTLLAWHGWTQSSRQTLWRESIELPNPMLRQDGAILNQQADESDPFMEIDHKLGQHFATSLKWKKFFHLTLGKYDNRAKPYLLKNGNYAWHTKFSHIGFNLSLKNDWKIIGQYLNGSTLMQSEQRENIVYNDFTNASVLLSKKIEQHRASVRIEKFRLEDMDYTEYDDNNEKGHSFTLAYIYRINRQYFLHYEYTQIKSERPSRAYHQQATNLTETLLSFAVRYYF